MNCVFAKEAADVVSGKSWWQKFKMRVLGSKVYIGHEKRDGWTGELPFFLFWCRDCQSFAKDYPHGQPSDRYLICSNCDITHDFTTISGVIEDWRRRDNTQYEIKNKNFSE